MIFKAIRQKRPFQTSITLVASADWPCSPRGRADIHTSRYPRDTGGGRARYKGSPFMGNQRMEAIYRHMYVVEIELCAPQVY